MGWIAGVIVFIGSLLLYIEIKTKRIQRQREEIERLEGKLERVQVEEQLREDVGEIQKGAEKKVQEIQADHRKLIEEIPSPQDRKELSDEAKQSATAISSHIADRYRKRLQNRK